MDALVSGEAGAALLVDGAALRSMGLGAAAKPVQRRRDEMRFLFGDARDLQVLENVTEREVAVRLERAAARIDGLQLILFLLDATLAADTRQEAAAEAEDLLAEPGMVEAVEGILYAHPLPAGADPAGALHACANRAPRAAEMVSQLVARQPLIGLVRQAWEQLPPALFGTSEDRERVQAVWVREELFRSLVLLREAGQPLNPFKVAALLNPEVKKLASHRAILSAWIEPLRQDRKERQSENQRLETADIVAEEEPPAYHRGLDSQKRLASVDSPARSSPQLHLRRILVAAANPSDVAHLRLDQEVREIEDGLQRGLLRAKDRDRFLVERRPAVRALDLQQAIMDVDPEIVHFSGHGAGTDGLVLEDDEGRSRVVPPAALGNLFRRFADRVQCVVLDSCHSQQQAEAIAHHIRYVVGMKKEIGDRAAINFAIGFYCALGAGRSIPFAYQVGCSAIELQDLPGHLNPVLLGGFESTHPVS
jgi:hypothetical protein